VTDGVTDPQGVLIIGMHRSGTSAATRLINMLGLSLCKDDDLLQELDGNETGHWESVTMNTINERLLAEMGRAWWCPPPAGEAYAEAEGRIQLEGAEAAAAFEAAHPEPGWVAKDPRTCLTLPFWRRALNRPLVVVFMYRNLVEVAHSLRRRNVFTLPRSVATWERYNRLALEHCAGLPTLMTRYDELVTDPVAWCEQVRAFLEWQGLQVGNPPAEAIEAFIEPQLRHSRHDLDDIRAGYETSLPVFEALESRLGPWEAFESPSLPPEPTWVEAEFVSIGAVQPEPLPQPLYPCTSRIVLALGRPLAPVLANMTERIPPYAEGVIVTDATASAPEQLLQQAKAKQVTVVQLAPGTPAGAARNAAVQATSTDLIDFRDYGARDEGWWFMEARRAMTAGYSAVTAHVVSTEGGGGYGLNRAGEGAGTEPVWAGPPAGKVGPVDLLAPQCFMVRREVLTEVGGFVEDEPVGEDLGEDVYEFSERLRAHGHRVASTRDAVVKVPDEGLWPRGTAARASVKEES
jgi:hypothetical protein